jgi:riboflavin kinase/FMN adenylyltransferase
MEIVRLESLAPRGWRRSAVTVGNFDGVHRGHQELVAAVVEDARATGGSAVVLTFDPHPSRVLAPDRAPSTLMTVAQKAEALQALGVQRLAVLPFTFELSRESPEDFARLVLSQAIGARMVVVGRNFRFGRDRAGDIGLLQDLGHKLRFRVHGLPPVLHEGEPISSSRIREAIARGAVDAAAELLGRRFFIDGPVVRGLQRGRTLGAPTANIEAENEALPGAGVYACWSRLIGSVGPEPIPAVVNVGRRPTFGGDRTTVEAHLLHFDGDLYGARIRLEFAKRLREERAFPNAEALKDQISHDIVAAGRVLEKAP